MMRHLRLLEPQHKNGLQKEPRKQHNTKKMFRILRKQQEVNLSRVSISLNLIKTSLLTQSQRKMMLVDGHLTLKIQMPEKYNKIQINSFKLLCNFPYKMITKLSKNPQRQYTNRQIQTNQKLKKMMNQRQIYKQLHKQFQISKKITIKIKLTTSLDNSSSIKLTNRTRN